MEIGPAFLYLLAIPPTVAPCASGDKWWALLDSNQRQIDYESIALTD
jgi:hypothetical protein